MVTVMGTVIHVWVNGRRRMEENRIEKKDFEMLTNIQQKCLLTCTGKIQQPLDIPYHSVSWNRAKLPNISIESGLVFKEFNLDS